MLRDSSKKWKALPPLKFPPFLPLGWRWFPAFPLPFLLWLVDIVWFSLLLLLSLPFPPLLVAQDACALHGLPLTFPVKTLRVSQLKLQGHICPTNSPWLLFAALCHGSPVTHGRPSFGSPMGLWTLCWEIWGDLGFISVKCESTHNLSHAAQLFSANR